MDTPHAKYSLVVKLSLAIACLLAGFVASLLYLDLQDIINSSSPMRLGANSSLIILARFDTNAPISLVVTEVWKQSADASTQSVRVGTKISSGWARNAGPVPDGAVIFYHRAQPLIPLIKSGSSHLEPWAEYSVRQGQVDNMTITQFKKACGL